MQLAKKPLQFEAHPAELKILIAEDDRNDILLMRLAFKEAAVPAQLEFVHDGEQLLHFLQAALQQEQTGQSVFSPTLLLLDLRMPRLDGFQVLAWLHEHPRYERLPVIVFSGSDQPVDINRALSLGAVRYLVKPDKLSDLVQMVRGIHKFWQKLHPSDQGPLEDHPVFKRE